MQRIGNLDGSPFTLMAGALALALAACSVGESSDAPEGERAESGDRAGEATEVRSEAPPTVPEGTTLLFRVDRTVSTGSHEAGDAFTATLADPVRASDGSVALPAGTSSRWVVTQSESGSGSDQSLFAFRLESVESGGTPVPVEATVTDTEIQSEPGDSKTESAAKVAVGTAAGAIVGQILGNDTESTLKGAGVGAAVGTVVALTTRDGEARLAEGSTITVRLDEALRAR